MRYLVTDEFSRWLSASQPQISSVAVIGGSSSDPEVEVLKKILPEVRISYLGIENPNSDNSFLFFDLNERNADHSSKYDLILCSQVLEHIWNIENAFSTFKRILRQGKFLWLNCPASNMPHGSPHYYSAGYTGDFLSKNLEMRGFQILLNQQFGSKRNYFMTHALRFWPTERELARPVIFYNFQPGTLKGIFKKYVKDLPGRFISIFYSKKIRADISYSTETVVLAVLKD